jgi:hypothetical protein
MALPLVQFPDALSTFKIDGADGFSDIVGTFSRSGDA